MGADELELRVKGQGGYAVSRGGGEVVALDLTIDDELRRRVYLRDVVRQVQDLRKNSGLRRVDRIVLHLVGLDELEDGFEDVGERSLSGGSVRDEGVAAKEQRWNSMTDVKPSLG